MSVWLRFTLFDEINSFIISMDPFLAAKNNIKMLRSSNLET